MIFGLFLLAIIMIAWQLLIKGLFWKLIVGVAGWFGICIFMETYFPNSKFIAIYEFGMSWSQLVATCIVLMSMLYSKE